MKIIVQLPPRKSEAGNRHIINHQKRHPENFSATLTETYNCPTKNHRYALGPKDAVSSIETDCHSRVDQIYSKQTFAYRLPLKSFNLRDTQAIPVGQRNTSLRGIDRSPRPRADKDQARSNEASVEAMMPRQYQINCT